MKIGLASDHGGYNLKSEIIKHLKEKGWFDITHISMDEIIL